MKTKKHARKLRGDCNSNTLRDVNAKTEVNTRPTVIIAIPPTISPAVRKKIGV